MLTNSRAFFLYVCTRDFGRITGGFTLRSGEHAWNSCDARGGDYIGLCADEIRELLSTMDVSSSMTDSSSITDSSISSCTSNDGMLSSSDDVDVSLDCSTSSTDCDPDTSSTNASSSDRSATPDDGSMDPLSQPLYNGATITLLDSYMLLMQHSLRHSLTKQAFSDLLRLVGMLLPNKSMVSYYRLHKFFLDMYGDIMFTKHYCCAECHSPLHDKEGSCCNGCSSTAIEFLTVSVASQLKRKLEGDICEKIEQIFVFVCVHA